MEIFQRQKFNEIEGINFTELRQILSRTQSDDMPAIDSIVFDTILLDDNTRIKCIKNHYSLTNGTELKKGKANNTCVAIQKFYKINCRPYNCTDCHMQMMQKRDNREVKIIRK